jgi:ABC-type multidrug transport system ATPase subunit
MLSARAVTKRYGDTLALDGTTFDLERGTVMAVVGSNGAGKSTLIKSIVGLVRFEGQILVDGVDAGRDGRRARRQIGYLPQTPAFHPDLTVRETATFYARLRGLDDTAARTAVEAVGLAEQAEKRADALSGGMRQRLALAIVQLGSPALLVLDEPATGLDVAARLELRRFIQDQRAAGRTVLLSTHWLDDVPTIADQVLVLEAGRTKFLGPASEFAAAAAPQSRLYLRVNGHTHDAASLLRSSRAGDVAQTGEWLVITCPAGDKARALEVLVGAGIAILDFRVEDGALPAAGVLAEVVR